MKTLSGVQARSWPGEWPLTGVLAHFRGKQAKDRKPGGRTQTQGRGADPEADGEQLTGGGIACVGGCVREAGWCLGLEADAELTCGLGLGMARGCLPDSSEASVPGRSPPGHLPCPFHTGKKGQQRARCRQLGQAGERCRCAQDSGDAALPASACTSAWSSEDKDNTLSCSRAALMTRTVIYGQGRNVTNGFQ